MNMRAVKATTDLDRSLEGPQYRDSKSYRVGITEGDKSVTVEVQISLGDLEGTPNPEERIERHFQTGPLPENKAVITVKLD